MSYQLTISYCFYQCPGRKTSPLIRFEENAKFVVKVAKEDDESEE